MSDQKPPGQNASPIGLGIAGLGMAGAVMVQAATAHKGYVLKAAADPQAGPRQAFVRDFNASAAWVHLAAMPGVSNHEAQLTE